MVELTQMCTELARHCASSGMVLAMHHIQVACMVRHGQGSEFFRQYLREIHENQLLIASVTSEVGVGGDTRTSRCSVVCENGRFKLDKAATTVSYGEDADALLVTCRRDPDAAPSDQVLVLVKKSDYDLAVSSEWDTMGMRGTHSPAAQLSSSGPVEQIVPGSFADSSSQTMVPFSHILWAGVWLGIAEDAAGKASAFVRAAARKNPGTTPPTATPLARLQPALQSLRCHVKQTAADAELAMSTDEGNESLSTMGFALRMNNLKIAASEAVVDLVHQSLRICGIAGYRNGTPFSLGRQLRDAHSAQLMIGNDRIIAKSAPLMTIYRDN